MGIKHFNQMSKKADWFTFQQLFLLIFALQKAYKQEQWLQQLVIGE